MSNVIIPELQNQDEDNSKNNIPVSGIENSKSNLNDENKDNIVFNNQKNKENNNSNHQKNE